MKKVGLFREWQIWWNLIEKRRELLDAIGSDDKADHQMRREMEGIYGLFTGGVPNVVLELAEALLPLYEVREGRPAVRGRK